MKSVNFFGHEISRLIVGDNALNGYSYIPDEISGEEMKAYQTREVWQKNLFEMEESGYTCMLPLAEPFVLENLKEYKRNGGKMQFIFQPFMGAEQRENMKAMAELEPIGIYHQGTTTDNLYEAGEIETIKERIKIYKEMGIPIGLGSHMPEVISRSEKEEWGAEFYLCCLQNARVNHRAGKISYLPADTKADLLFYPEDRKIMLDVIAETQKPCIAYKVFAGGQMFSKMSKEQIREAIKASYREVFSAIKPGDAAAIGVFQKYGDQIREDAELFEQVTRELQSDK